MCSAVRIGLLIGLLAGPPSSQPAAAPMPSVDGLIRTLQHNPSASQRARAAKELHERGPAAKPAARALCQAMLDPSPQVRLAAADALEGVAPQIYFPAHLLFKNLDGPSYEKAVAALTKLGHEGNAAAPMLIFHLRASLQAQEYFRRQDVQTRQARQTRDQRNQFGAEDDLEALLMKWLAQALARAGKDAETEEADYLKRRREGMPAVVKSDIRALTAVAGDEKGVARAIGLVLRSGEVSLRVTALETLSDLAAAHAPLRPLVFAQVSPHLRDPAPEARLTAIHTVGRLGPAARKAVPLLKTIKAKDSSDKLRAAAAEALEQIERKDEAPPRGLEK